MDVQGGQTATLGRVNGRDQQSAHVFAADSAVAASHKYCAASQINACASGVRIGNGTAFRPVAPWLMSSHCPF
jgi:hypothetical protein